LFNLQSSFVYCALKEEEFATNEKEIINDLKADFEIEKKSNGQRLRNVFYKLYEQDNEGFLTFVKYYDHKMEQLINHFKSKLDI
jgi:predicted solute-binding protein